KYNAEALSGKTRAGAPREPRATALFLRGLVRVLLAEAIDAALRVDQALLARVEGMTSGAHVHREFLLRRAGLEHVSAGAGDAHEFVLGVDAVLHLRLLRGRGGFAGPAT